MNTDVHKRSEATLNITYISRRAFFYKKSCLIKNDTTDPSCPHRDSMRLLTLITSYLSVAAAATLGKRAPTPGTLSQVTSFGTAPTKAGFYIYVPKKLAASPGIIVAIHYCTGTAQAYYTGSPYATLAEQYGFVVIYPSSPNSGTCWDVSSKQTLTTRVVATVTPLQIWSSGR